MLKRPLTKKFWFACAVVSLAGHFATVEFFGGRPFSTVKPQKTVKVRIVEKPADPTPPPPPPPPKPQPKPKPKPKQQKTASERPPPAKPNPTPPKPVQGLTADAMNANSKVAAPLGNTLMTADSGERLKQAPPALDGDLSAEPQLIRASVVKPQYTDAAIEANLEGTALVEVFVDENGKVTDVELKRRVGYGMDERILQSARSARFVPRKNRFGLVESGWTEIKYSLQLP